jgi:hypothetical protein
MLRPFEEYEICGAMEQASKEQRNGLPEYSAQTRLSDYHQGSCQLSAGKQLHRSVLDSHR